MAFIGIKEINGPHHHNHSLTKEDWADAMDAPDEYYEQDDEGRYTYQKPQYEKHTQRSIFISGLSEGTTYADISAAVKGGMLLDIHLRTFDKVATISFLHTSSAQEFLRHSRRNDLYIRGKRVSTGVIVAI